MAGSVVDDQVQHLPSRGILIDQFQELDVVLGAVSIGAGADDLARSYVQRRIQIGHSVAFVIMRLALRDSRPQRQYRLRPFQRLHLRFLVNTEDNRVLRGVQVQPDDILQLLLELRIVAGTEMLYSMGLQIVSS